MQMLLKYLVGKLGTVQFSVTNFISCYTSLKKAPQKRLPKKWNFLWTRMIRLKPTFVHIYDGMFMGNIQRSEELHKKGGDGITIISRDGESCLPFMTCYPNSRISCKISLKA